MDTMRVTRTKNKKVIASIVLILVLAAGTGVYAYMRNNDSDYVYGPDEARTTSEEPTAQPDFTDGTDREAGNSLNEFEGSGGITDSNGADSSDTSQPIVSDTGEITVYLPHKNSLIKPGQEVSGTSKLSKVSYRIIDDLTGMIGTGELKVVDGKFSGKLQFDTGAKEGRLDIFGTKEDATEFSSVEIPVRFK